MDRVFHGDNSDISGVFDGFSLGMPSGGSPDGTGQWPVPPMVINALSGQAGGGAFVPDGTLDKATREPSDQSLGYFLSPSGLDGGSPASEGRVAGFGQTGLLAANGSVTFPAFIFKNALAANNGKSREDRI